MQLPCCCRASRSRAWGIWDSELRRGEEISPHGVRLGPPCCKATTRRLGDGSQTAPLVAACSPPQALLVDAAGTLLSPSEPAAQVRRWAVCSRGLRGSAGQLFSDNAASQHRGAVVSLSLAPPLQLLPEGP